MRLVTGRLLRTRGEFAMGGNPKAADLPPAFIRCMRPEDRLALALASPRHSEPMVPALTRTHGQKPAGGAKAKAKGPTKTEAEYARRYLTPVARFEGLTIRLENGHRYTPDFVTFGLDGRFECHEVKGSYRLGSYQRARLAFDQARVEYPAWRWVWAERQRDGTWRVTT